MFAAWQLERWVMNRTCGHRRRWRGRKRVFGPGQTDRAGDLAHVRLSRSIELCSLLDRPRDNIWRQSRLCLALRGKCWLYLAGGCDCLCGTLALASWSTRSTRIYHGFQSICGDWALLATHAINFSIRNSVGFEQAAKASVFLDDVFRSGLDLG